MRARLYNMQTIDYDTVDVVGTTYLFKSSLYGVKAAHTASDIDLLDVNDTTSKPHAPKPL